ncbi:N-acetyltransferase family protein [Citreimonas sp.]|uniref:N-acetyltransferase family protein n=1 Tax=Citreimonas sp. TaxID=3036715 RepID=UPI004059FF7B
MPSDPAGVTGPGTDAAPDWRSATARDLPILRRAQSETFASMRGRAPTAEETARMDAATREALNDPGQTIELSQRDGLVCAYYWLRGLTERDPFLVDLHVLPGHRRAGLGRLCLERALRRAAEAGADRIALSVAPGNAPALALYRRYGARTLAATDDAILLALPVPAQSP